MDAVTMQVMEMRNQGLPEQMIQAEMQRRGASPEQVQEALGQESEGYGSQPRPGEENIYERIEEITEGLVDEKWDELLSEVKKIIEWKEKVEEKQIQLQAELSRLKENFTTLHQGVLGRLETYDERMRDVGVELKAVGKVFKDVIPEFVENVKELRMIKEEMKR